MAARLRRPARPRYRHGRLDREHPVQRDARLRPARARKPPGLPRPEDRQSGGVFAGRGSSPLRPGSPSTAISTPRPALIHEGPGLRAFHVAGFDRVDSEPGGADQLVHLAIEMTSAGDPSPERRQPQLPAANLKLGRKAVLTKEQPTAWLEPPPHLGDGGARVRDRAQGPGDYDCVKDRIGKG